MSEICRPQGYGVQTARFGLCPVDTGLLARYERIAHAKTRCKTQARRDLVDGLSGMRGKGADPVHVLTEIMMREVSICSSAPGGRRRKPAESSSSYLASIRTAATHVVRINYPWPDVPALTRRGDLLKALLFEVRLTEP